MTTEIRTVHAFWHANQPGGFGIGIKFDGELRGDHFARWLLEDLPAWNARANVRDVENQLWEFALRRDDLNEEETGIAIMCVFWLVARNHLANDEYNGLVWSVVHDNALLTTEQNPILLDLDRGVREGIDVTDIAKNPAKTSNDAFTAVMDWARKQTPEQTRIRMRREAAKRARQSRRKNRQ